MLVIQNLIVNRSLICECFTNQVLLVGHFDIEAICHREDWSRGWFGIGKQCVRSIWSSFCKFPANLFCLCLFYNWDQGQVKKKIVVKQGKTTSVDKEILGIAKSCETTFQDLIKVALDGDIAWHNLLFQRNRTLKKRPPLLSRTKTGVRVKTKGPLDTVGNKLICSQITSPSFFCSFSSTMQLDFSIKKITLSVTEIQLWMQF